MYRFKITIDKTKVSGTNTNFVYLFSEGCSSIPTGFWSHVIDTSTGLDIRFFDSDGVTELKRDVVSYSSGGNKVEAWVQISSLSTATNKTIYCQYGGPTRSNDTAIWSDINAQLMLHMQNLVDSSANGYTVTNSGASSVVGKIENGYSFATGSSNFMSVSNSSQISYTNGISVSFWINFTSLPGIRTSVCTYPNQWGDGFTFDVGGGSNYFYVEKGSSPNYTYADDTTTTLTPGVWYHYVGTYNPSSGYAKIYLNGSNTATSAQNVGLDITSVNDVYLGKRADASTGYLDAIIDNVKIHNSLLSDAWVATEYANQNAPSTFSYAGVEEDITRTYRFPIIISNSFIVDTSSLLIDESGKTWTSTGAPTLNTTTYKFSKASCYFNGSSYIQTADSTDFAFGTGDYTIDFWVNTAQATTGVVAYQGDVGGSSSAQATQVYINGGKIGFQPDYSSFPSNHNLQSSTTSNDNLWHHVACVRYGNVFTLYVDGDSKATATFSYTALDTPNPFFVGRQNTSANPFTGYVDEFRISKGIARWTTNFTPPTVPYSSDSYTKVLLHFGTYVTLSNFPYLFSEGCPNIPAGFWTRVVSSSGLDIRFFDSDGVTEIKREIVAYTSLTKKVEVWVQISSLSTATNKTIYCQYGGPTRSNDTAIWIDAGYKAVYHSQGNANDSAYGNTGTINGATVNTSGKIESAYDFDGISKKITITNTANIIADNNSYVMSAWVYLADSAQNAGILGKWNGSGNFPQETLSVTGADSRLVGSGKKIGMLLRIDNSTERGAYTNSDYATGSWRYIVGVADKNANTVKIYIDGVSVAVTVDHNSGSWPNVGNTSDLIIGSVGSLYLSGTVDEARISKTAPADAWVLTEYNNQGSPSTFSYAGSEEDITRVYRLPIYIDKTKIASLNGITTFIDETGKIWTPTSNVALSTNNYKFGPTSGYFSGSYGAGGVISTPDSTDWTWGTNDFTAECWINTTDSEASGGRNLFFNGAPGNTQNTASLICYFYLGIVTFRCIPASYTDINSTIVINDGNWHHIACVRYSGTFYLYVDGVSQGTPVTQIVDFGDKGYRMSVGGTYGNSSYNFNGYIDEVRISKDIARYTSNFTPPTVPYSIDSYTKVLLHFGTYLSNFTYLFNEGCAGIPDSFWAHSTTTGNLDLRFFDTNGRTELKRELVTYDSLNKKVEAWVQIPSLGTGYNKQIWCQYGSTAKINDASMWSDNSTTAVYHFQGNANDSLTLNNGTVTGAVQIDGKVSKAYSFNGTTDKIVLANNIDFSGDISVAAWINLSALPANGGDFASDYCSILSRAIWCSATVRGWEPFSFGISSAGKFRLNCFYTASCDTGFTGDVYETSSSVISTSTWYHVAVTSSTHSSSSRVVKFYLNGTLQASTQIQTQGPTFYQDGSMQTQIGSSLLSGGTTKHNLAGIIDDLRIYNTTILTEDQIGTLAANQGSPSTFSTCGNESNTGESVTVLMIL